MHDARHDPAAETTHYDTRTITEREADELAALRLELTQARDAIEYLTIRTDAQESKIAALLAAVERHADALQSLVLRGAP